MHNVCMEPMQSLTTTHRGESLRKEGLMASEFHILLDGQMIVRTYNGTPAEQFAAYVAEFPIGSGANLRYCRDTEPAVPLVIFG